MLSNAHEKKDPNEPIPEWISICTMLSQNAVHPDAKGTMTLQKLTGCRKKKEKRKKVKVTQRKKEKSEES